MEVFGTIEDNTIFLPSIPYQVRFNCKDGGIFVGGNEPDHRKTNPTDKVEISIIKIGKFFGDLGETKNAVWMQLFFVASPTVKPEILPLNTVCVAYIKNKSISNLNNAVTDVMSKKIEPATGIFIISFNKEVGKKGTYYSINFDWKERKTKAEKDQLPIIQEFWNANHENLMDLDGTRQMIDTTNLTAQEMSTLINQNRLKANEPEQKQLTSA